MRKIKRALISVSNKSGLILFARALHKHGVEMISTGGTLQALRDAQIPALPVEGITGFPEMLDGRVKTLHPIIHGGLLFRRDLNKHRKEAAKHGIQAIDLVIVNLYPFEQVTENPKVTLETAIENIDIGGPSMLRSAAKNHDAVCVVCDPQDYPSVLEEMDANQGKVSQKLCQALALKVFERTAAYDHAIARFLKNKLAAPTKEANHSELPEVLDVSYEKSKVLRYGENPHQRAALYTRKAGEPKFEVKQLHGKELSYNNLLDIEAAIDVIREFTEPAACVIKHSNPCGVAEASDLVSAVGQAIECDSMSAFGGIIGINRPCTRKVAEAAFGRLKFFEVFIAPSFDAESLKVLKQRTNLRVIETGALGAGGPFDLRFLKMGILVQDRDHPLYLDLKEIKKNLKFPTRKKLVNGEIDDLLFAMKCAKVVKSNAIVITQGRQTVGIGAGQMSRVDSVEIACRKAGYRTEGGFLGSDAFFPMPDSIEVAHEYKIRAIIQPGGSLKDADVVAACDRFGIAMAMIGRRYFRH